MSQKTQAEKARPRPRWGGLAFRVMAGLGLGITVVMVGAGIFTLRTQRRHMEALIAANARQTTETIRRSTRQAMLRNEPEELNRILQSIGAQERIDRIRIYDDEGHVRRSTVPMEVDDPDETAPGLSPQDRAEGVHIIEEDSGGRLLSLVAPIPNEPVCSSCHVHDSAADSLGTLDVRFSLADVDRHVGQSQAMLGTSVALTVLAAMGVSGFLIWRLVIRPVRGMTRAVDRVASGDLQARVPILSDDEMGEMAVHWNHMIQELHTTRRALRDLNRNLEEGVEEKTRELRRAHEHMLVVEKMASLGKLSAVVAHEINNPLAGITTYARLLRKRFEKNGQDAQRKDAIRILTMVDEEASRCGRIVRNLLLFSRTPGARFTQQDPRALLERCSMLVQHQAELQEVVVSLDLSESLPPLTCDAAQIQQVFLVLAMNAIEAMPEGGGLDIRVRTDEVAGEVAISFEDTGVGVPPEALSRIFEPFFTTKEEGQGVGLGLAVAYGIVQRHGGRIEVTSSLGMGATFRVRLPLDPAEELEEDPHGKGEA